MKELFELDILMWRGFEFELYMLMCRDVEYELYTVLWRDVEFIVTNVTELLNYKELYCNVFLTEILAEPTLKWWCAEKLATTTTVVKIILPLCFF